MENLPDIPVNLPVELLDDLSEVIHVGILRANISAGAKEELASWWEAEEEFLLEEIENRKLRESE